MHFNKLYGLRESLIARYNFYKKDIKPEVIKPFPFAEEVCRKIAVSGGRNYVITHRGESTLEFLKHHGMLDYFIEIVTKQYGFKRKPDPEAFLYLIEKYKINKSTALVIEDRECEILGGKAAGVKVCLYDTNNVQFNETPDYCIDSLKKLIDIGLI